MSQDNELFEVVLDDLDHLTREMDQDLDDATLRRTSPILRRLLVQGDLSKAANRLNRRIRILAPLLPVPEEEELARTVIWQFGGARYRGLQAQGARIIRGVLSEEEIKQRVKAEGSLQERKHPIPLEEFLNQPSYAVHGTLISRRDVIKYVANKLGGDHLDTTRNRKGDEKFALLDLVRNSLSIAEKNSIFYELLSIGQLVMNSRDIHALRRHLRNVI